MKQIFLLVSLAISLVAFAQNDGASCENAIYVDSTFSQVVEPGRTYWYVANTEDLPVMVYFFPDEISEKEPEVYVDFTCTPGVYDDPNIVYMVEKAAEANLHFPMSADFDVVEVDGKMAYRMGYARELLDIMAGYGVNYNVPVYVSVKTPITGTAQIDNHKAVLECTDLCIRAEMQDTLHLVANDTMAYYYFPVSEWVGNQLRFTWTGSTPLRAYLESDCEFDTLTSRYVYEFADSLNGMAVQHILDEDINNYVRYSDDGNLYVKFVATEDGEVYIDDYKNHGAVTINTCQKNIKTTAIAFPTAEAGLALTANVTSASKSYRFKAEDIKGNNIRLKWKSEDHKTAVAYFANFCGFDLTYKDPDVVDTVHFVYDEEEDIMYADMLQERVDRLSTMHTDGWLFMQIHRIEAGTFWWDTYVPPVYDCDTKSQLINQVDSVYMPANSYHISYKINADEWSQNNHTFVWKGNKQAYMFIADTCSFPLAPYNEHVGLYQVINSNDSVTISKDEFEYLAYDYADGYGNLYIRIRSTEPGTLYTRLEKQGGPTGLTTSTVINGRKTKLVLIEQSIYIQVEDGEQQKLYDLTGREVVLE